MKRSLALLVVVSLAASLAVPALGVSTPPADPSASALVRPTAPDVYEPDDDIAQATVFPVSPALPIQTRTFDPIGDVDWIRFDAQVNHTYEIYCWDGSAMGCNPTLGIRGLNVTSDYIYNDDRLLGDTTTSEIQWTCDQSGTYYVRIQDRWNTGGQYQIYVQDWGMLPNWPGITRSDGADRYAVAAGVAAAMFNYDYAGHTDAIIVSGLDRAAADALSASALAGQLDAPILLINQDSASRILPSATRAAVNAMEAANPSTPPHFWCVGGSASVPSWVRTRLAAEAPGATFDVIGGSDRYTLAAHVASHVRAELGYTPGACLVVNGEDPAFFYDGLVASPIAFSQRFPVLLTRKASVPGATSAERALYSACYIVGNGYEVGNGVRSSLVAMRIGSEAYPYSSRYDRTHLARYVAEYGLLSGWTVNGRNYIYITNKLADALTGGCLAGRERGVILLTLNASTLGQSATDFIQTSRNSMVRNWIIGGNASVTPAVVTRLQQIQGTQPWPH